MCHVTSCKALLPPCCHRILPTPWVSCHLPILHRRIWKLREVKQLIPRYPAGSRQGQCGLGPSSVCLLSPQKPVPWEVSAFCDWAGEEAPLTLGLVMNPVLGVRYQLLPGIPGPVLLPVRPQQHQPNHRNYLGGDQSLCVLRAELWGHALVCPHLQETEGGGGGQTVLPDRLGRGPLPRRGAGAAGSEAAEIHLQGRRKVSVIAVQTRCSDRLLRSGLLERLDWTLFCCLLSRWEGRVGGWGRWVNIAMF